MVLADSPRSSHKHLTNSLLTFWAFGLYWWKVGTCEGRSTMESTFYRVTERFHWFVIADRAI